MKPGGEPVQRSRAARFVNLELEVEGHRDLLESLGAFVSPERMEGDNQWECEEGVRVDAVKGFRIAELPAVLLLQLKRFAFDYQTMERRKVDQPFAFPPVVDMAPFVGNGEASAPSTASAASAASAAGVEGAVGGGGVGGGLGVAPALYELVAVLIHKGNAAGRGHYIAYSRVSLPASAEEVQAAVASGEGGSSGAAAITASSSSSPSSASSSSTSSHHGWCVMNDAQVNVIPDGEFESLLTRLEAEVATGVAVPGEGDVEWDTAGNGGRAPQQRGSAQPAPASDASADPVVVEEVKGGAGEGKDEGEGEGKVAGEGGIAAELAAEGERWEQRKRSKRELDDDRRRQAVLDGLKCHAYMLVYRRKGDSGNPIATADATSTAIAAADDTMMATHSAAANLPEELVGEVDTDNERFLALRRAYHIHRGMRRLEMYPANAVAPLDQPHSVAMASMMRTAVCAPHIVDVHESSTLADITAEIANGTLGTMRGRLRLFDPSKRHALAYLDLPPIAPRHRRLPGGGPAGGGSGGRSGAAAGGEGGSDGDGGGPDPTLPLGSALDAHGGSVSLIIEECVEDGEHAVGTEGGQPAAYDAKEILLDLQVWGGAGDPASISQLLEPLPRPSEGLGSGGAPSSSSPGGGWDCKKGGAESAEETKHNGLNGEDESTTAPSHSWCRVRVPGGYGQATVGDLRLTAARVMGVAPDTLSFVIPPGGGRDHPTAIGGAAEGNAKSGEGSLLRRDVGLWCGDRLLVHVAGSPPSSDTATTAAAAAAPASLLLDAIRRHVLTIAVEYTMSASAAWMKGVAREAAGAAGASSSSSSAVCCSGKVLIQRDQCLADLKRTILEAAFGLSPNTLPAEVEQQCHLRSGAGSGRAPDEDATAIETFGVLDGTMVWVCEGRPMRRGDREALVLLYNPGKVKPVWCDPLALEQDGAVKTSVLVDVETSIDDLKQQLAATCLSIASQPLPPAAPTKKSVVVGEGMGEGEAAAGEAIANPAFACLTTLLGDLVPAMSAVPMSSVSVVASMPVASAAPVVDSAVGPVGDAHATESVPAVGGAGERAPWEWSQPGDAIGEGFEVQVSFKRPVTKYKVIRNSDLFRGRVTRVNRQEGAGAEVGEGGTFYVEYADGDKEDKVKLEWMKWRRGESAEDRAKYAPVLNGTERIVVGCRVEAQCKDWKQHYGGVVTRMNKDKTYVEET